MIRLAGQILTAVMIALVWVYRLTLRPLLPQACRFYPSCSEYFIQAVRIYGPIRGGAKGVWRVCRCHPFNEGGFDRRDERRASSVSRRGSFGRFHVGLTRSTLAETSVDRPLFRRR